MSATYKTLTRERGQDEFKSLKILKQLTPSPVPGRALLNKYNSLLFRLPTACTRDPFFSEEWIPRTSRGKTKRGADRIIQQRLPGEGWGEGVKDGS